VIDMSFGVFGMIPLYVVRRRIKRLEAAAVAASPRSCGERHATGPACAGPARTGPARP
jgi:hypothetical protein